MATIEESRTPRKNAGSADGSRESQKISEKTDLGGLSFSHLKQSLTLPIADKTVKADSSPALTQHSSHDLFTIIERLFEQERSNHTIDYRKKDIELNGGADQINALFSDNVIIVRHGDLVYQNESISCRFSAGYCLTNPSMMLGKDIGEITSTYQSDEIELIAIPRHLFHRWLKQDQEFLQAINQHISKAHQVIPMPHEAKERIRIARDQNIQTVVTREAIDFVNRSGGLYDILNPQAVEIYAPSSEAKISTTEQIWHLVQSSAVATLYVEPEHLLNLAREVRAEIESLQDLENENALVKKVYNAFHRRLETLKTTILESHFPFLAVALEIANYPIADHEKIIERTLQIRWLHKRLSNRFQPFEGAKELWKEVVEQELHDALTEKKELGISHVMELLDRHLEALFNQAVALRLPELVSIGFTRLPVELNVYEAPSEELPHDHPIRDDLAELNRRLNAGEQSAVGGNSYAEMRFSKETLDIVARGEVPIVLYDGDHQNGLNFIRDRFGRNRRDPAVLDQAISMELQGTYGAFSKSWVYFRDGRSVLLVSYLGESRQLSNASALMLYKDSQGRHARPDNFILARDKDSNRQRLNNDLKNLLQNERSRAQEHPILGEKNIDPDSLPTHVMILQHPDQLREALGKNLEMRELKSECLGSVFIGYYRHPDGQISRLIIPKVGSKGLYGDTAGTFLKVVFEDKLVKFPQPDIFFTGTAGGFAETNQNLSFKDRKIEGLPKMDVGSLFMPKVAVGDPRDTFAMHTILSQAEAYSEREVNMASRKVQERMNAAQIHRNSSHYSIGAPALETFELIDQLVEQGYSSIDVESGPIMRAIEEIRKIYPAITFTPIYSYSDNPLEARNNPSATLAYGGPLSEGSKKAPHLYQTIASFLELAHTMRVMRERSSQKFAA